MSTIKTALKAAKAALDARKDIEAIEHIDKVLLIDPKNYLAYVDKSHVIYNVVSLTLVPVVEMYFLV